MESWTTWKAPWRESGQISTEHGCSIEKSNAKKYTDDAAKLGTLTWRLVPRGPPSFAASAEKILYFSHHFSHFAKVSGQILQYLKFWNYFIFRHVCYDFLSFSIDLNQIWAIGIDRMSILKLSFSSSISSFPNWSKIFNTEIRSRIQIKTVNLFSKIH